MTDSPSTVKVRPGSFEEALANGQRLLEEHPEAALKQAETLVRLKKDPRAFRLAAAACRKLGLKADAHGAELGAIEASFEVAELKAAALAQSEGRSEAALKILEQHLQVHADDLLAQTMAAEVSIQHWDLGKAEQMLRAILERAPGFLRASMLLASCLNRQVRTRDAIRVLDGVVARKPQNVPALTQLAQLNGEIGNNEQATRIFERLRAIEPDQATRWAQLAHHYRIVGRQEDSIGAFRKALSIEPFNGTAWWNLANFFPQVLRDEDEEALAQALIERTGQADEAALHLSLGLLAGRRGNYSAAFKYISAGKEARLAGRPYDPDPISTAVDGVIDLFTPNFYERRRSVGWSDSSPIFIIGMPRSGTTLVERVLGRHSAIEGAGELRIMEKLAELVRQKADRPEHYAAMLETASDAQLAWVGQKYVAASSDYRRTDKPFFIDKNNLNWMQIGLILLALPNAKIIDIRRNALDCCWANFKMLFSGGFPATNDLRQVGQIYRDYVRLFDAMAIVAPGRILSVRYAEVVDDIEAQTRRMLEFIGLEYEPDCIAFHLSKDAVATPSSEQVRRPLNREGIGSAEPYRQWLGPLIEELGPLADDRA